MVIDWFQDEQAMQGTTTVWSFKVMESQYKLIKGNAPYAQTISLYTNSVPDHGMKQWLGLISFFHKHKNSLPIVRTQPWNKT